MGFQLYLCTKLAKELGNRSRRGLVHHLTSTFCDARSEVGIWDHPITMPVQHAGYEVVTYLDILLHRSCCTRFFENAMRKWSAVTASAFQSPLLAAQRVSNRLPRY